jgi:hypothetical protein
MSQGGCLDDNNCNVSRSDGSKASVKDVGSASTCRWRRVWYINTMTMTAISRHAKNGKAKVINMLILKHNLATSIWMDGGYMPNKSLCVSCQKVMYTTMPKVVLSTYARAMEVVVIICHFWYVLRVRGWRESNVMSMVWCGTKANTNVPRLEVVVYGRTAGVVVYSTVEYSEDKDRLDKIEMT